MRVKKTVDGVTTTYHMAGRVIAGETTDGQTIWYNYDTQSQLISIVYNHVDYFYVRNAQGDILALIDKAGNKVVEYKYNSWGAIVDVSGSMADSLGKKNPFRYRGYYYDEETGLYYVSSRYYDPEIGRWINEDVYISTGQGLLGNNMFVYCENNPVNRIDSTGQFWNEIWEFAKTAVDEIGKAMGVMSAAYAGCGGAAAVDGPLPFGDAVAGVGATLLTVGAIGYGIYQATQAKTEEITASPPNLTVIYRYGGTNPGNLTPKAKDKRTGLSFSTVPRLGAAMTTIEAINATGVVYAVQDGTSHVSVRPVDKCRF